MDKLGLRSEGKWPQKVLETTFVLAPAASRNGMVLRRNLLWGPLMLVQTGVKNCCFRAMPANTNCSTNCVEQRQCGCPVVTHRLSCGWIPKAESCLHWQWTSSPLLCFKRTGISWLLCVLKLLQSSFLVDVYGQWYQRCSSPQLPTPVKW